MNKYFFTKPGATEAIPVEANSYREAVQILQQKGEYFSSSKCTNETGYEIKEVSKQQMRMYMNAGMLLDGHHWVEVAIELNAFPVFTIIILDDGLIMLTN